MICSYCSNVIAIYEKGKLFQAGKMKIFSKSTLLGKRTRRGTIETGLSSS